jgi:hypothetical protein
MQYFTFADIYLRNADIECEAPVQGKSGMNCSTGCGTWAGR